ncbi:MAG: DUF374 domain-containing protein [Puniceicoccales bacterium]|nr:DUF374 domain-containing protein [Puniceicoccales bacterium]
MPTPPSQVSATGGSTATGSRDAFARFLPWLWVPTLYFMEGVPNSVVEKVAKIFLQDLGVEPGALTRIVAVAMLPWAIKPLWGPLVDLYSTRRRWVWTLQLALAGAVGALALGVFAGAGVAALCAALLLIALFSATHDIAADGFYLHALDTRGRDFFVGVRNCAFRLGVLLGQGLLIVAAGRLAGTSGWTQPAAWAAMLGALAALLFALGVFHRFVLPRPASDAPVSTPPAAVLRETGGVWAEFFRRRDIAALLLFFLLFRLAESHLGNLATVFLKAPAAGGGLALDNEAVGWIYGTCGVVALIAGGILGGVLAARFTFRRVVWPFVFALNLPDLAYVALAHFQPALTAGGGAGGDARMFVAAAVITEQFGYGVGYSALALVMLRVAAAHGARRSAVFAFATGLAFLGYLLPGFWAGDLQKLLGYENYFWWVMVCTLPGFWVTWLVMRGMPASAEETTVPAGTEETNVEAAPAAASAPAEPASAAAPARRVRKVAWWLLPFLAVAALLVRLWLRSLRLRMSASDAARWRATGGGRLVVFWHNRLLPAPELKRRFSPETPISALISASRDGAWLTAFFKLLGVGVVRGSSSWRGGAAMLEIVRLLAAGEDVGITPDGPRGPCYTMHRGVAQLAKKLDAPVVLVDVSYSRARRLKSWDGFYLPLPFSCAEVRLDFVPASDPDRQLPEDELCARLRARLLALTRDL